MPQQIVCCVLYHLTILGMGLLVSPNLIWAQDWQPNQQVVVIGTTRLLVDEAPGPEVYAGLPLIIQAVEPARDGAQPRLLVTYQKTGWLSAEYVKQPAEALAYFSERAQQAPEATSWVFASAVTLGTLNRHSEAIEVWKQLLAQTPNNQSYRNELAGCFLAIKRLDLAEKEYDELIRIAPSPAFYNNRGLVRRAQNNVDGARADFLQVLTLSPQMAAAFQNLVELEIEVGSKESAAKILEQWTAETPQNPGAWEKYVEFYTEEQNFEKVLAGLQQLQTLRPNDPQPALNRGILLRDLGRESEAADVFAVLIKMFPQDPRGYINRGVLLEQNQPEQAIADFSRALELTRDFDPFLHFRRGCAQLQKGDPVAALADLNRAIELAPKEMGYTRRGEAHALLQNWQEAVDDFNQALKLNPENHFARYRRGTVYQMQGNNAAALDDYNELVQRGVKAFEVYFNRGMILQNAEDWEGAARDLQAAWKINPDHPQVQQQLALLLAASPVGSDDDLSQAEQLAQNACQQSPQDHEAREVLAIVLGAQGKFEEALRRLEADVATPTFADSPRRSKLIELFRRQERFQLKE